MAYMLIKKQKKSNVCLNVYISEDGEISEEEGSRPKEDFDQLSSEQLQKLGNNSLIFP